MVRQSPCGAWQTNHSPLGERLRRHVMFILAADSSMKTRRVGSMPPSVRFHRRRALAISGRFCSAALCSFLIKYPQLGGHLMDRGDRASLAQALFDLRQGQIELFRPQHVQLPASLRQQPRLPPKKTIPRLDLRGPPPLLQQLIDYDHRHSETLLQIRLCSLGFIIRIHDSAPQSHEYRIQLLTMTAGLQYLQFWIKNIVTPLGYHR